MATNSDQDDIIAQNERLTTQLAASRQHASELKSQLDALRAEHQTGKTQIEQLRAEHGTAQQTLADRTRERDGLKTENDALKTRLADFDKAVAAKIAQMGFAKAPLTQAPQPGTTERNYTEECRAARGN